MSLRKVFKSFQAVSTNGLIFSFTLLLALKLDHLIFLSWWFIFTPLWWLFHAVISRGRFSLPVPPMPDGHWAPFHSVMTTPLLVVFEFLLCLYVQDKYGIDFKIIFLPLLVFEVAVLIFNVRVCGEVMPGDVDSRTRSYETVPLFWVSISTAISITAIISCLLKFYGDVFALGWWDLFINFGIAECFAFLVCTTWSNQSFRLSSYFREPTSYSLVVTYGGFDVNMYGENEKCGPVGRFAMKITFIIFQIILFMHFEGMRAYARNIPVLVLFSPLFLLQGLGVLFPMYKLLEKSVILIYSGGDSYRGFFNAIFGFFQRGARLLCWWCTDEGSREEQATLSTGEATGYNTFPREVVKKMPKSDLDEEEKGLCKVCFEDPINVVLLPCKHLFLCSTCCKKCKECSICRVLIEERMTVYYA